MVAFIDEHRIVLVVKPMWKELPIVPATYYQLKSLLLDLHKTGSDKLGAIKSLFYIIERLCHFQNSKLQKRLIMNNIIIISAGSFGREVYTWAMQAISYG